MVLLKQCSWGKRVRRYIGWLMSTLLIVFAIGVLAAVVPVFGNRGLIVRSGSMEPAIGVGDLVVVRPKTTGYQEGDVIAFRSNGQESLVVTHRITGVEQSGQTVSYTTQGDANNQADSSKVKPEHIIGRQVFSVPYLGKLLAFGKTKGGYISFIFIPALIVIASELRVIVRELSKSNKPVKPLVPVMPVIKRKRLDLNERGKLEKEKKPVMAPVLRYRDANMSSNLPPIPLKRRVAVPIDSITGRLVVSVARQVMAIAILAVMIPSTWAIYSDSEKSVGNMFVASACFDTDPCTLSSPTLSSSPSPSPSPSSTFSSSPSPSLSPASGGPSPSPTPSPTPSPSVSPSLLPSSVGDVVINEVMWMGSTVRAGDEWLELRNMTNQEINIGQWTIENAKTSKGTYQLPNNKTIPANGFFLIANYPESSANTALSVSPDVHSASFSFKNLGNGNLVLKNVGGTVIDEAKGDSWPEGVNGSPEKKSMERNDTPGDGMSAGSWHTCTDLACNDTTWWDVEGDDYGTPGGANL